MESAQLKCTLNDEVQTTFHSLTSTFGPAETKRTVEAIEQVGASDLAEMGLLMHRSGDTFAQRHVHDYSDNPLSDSTDPDRIQRRPDRYLEYVSTLTRALANIQGVGWEERENLVKAVTKELRDVAEIPTVDPGTGNYVLPSDPRFRQMFGIDSVVVGQPPVYRDNDYLESLSEDALRKKNRRYRRERRLSAGESTSRHFPKTQFRVYTLCGRQYPVGSSQYVQ